MRSCRKRVKRNTSSNTQQVSVKIARPCYAHAYNKKYCSGETLITQPGFKRELTGFTGNIPVKSKQHKREDCKYKFI